MINQSDKIKICFVARTAYSLFNPKAIGLVGSTHGGAEVDLYILANSLAKDSRYSISFIVGDFGQEDLEIYGDIKVYKCFVQDNVSKKEDKVKFRSKERKITNFINRLNNFTLIKSFLLLFILNKKVTKFKNIKRFAILFKKIDADIYFQEAAGSITGICAFLTKVFGKKFVYRTAHNNDCNGVFIKEFLEQGRIDGHLYEWGLLNTHSLITQNKENQDDLSSHHGLESVIIKNAYEIPEQISSQKDGVLWVARSVGWKQPNVFLDLAKSNPEYDFTMICPQANEDGVDFEILEGEAGAIPNLIFHKHVPFAEIDLYFQKTKIFVNTSVYEGYPNTYVQAAKNGTPILSLNVNPDDFLNVHDCGFCAEGDFDLMNQLLKEILEDEEKYKIKSQNAYKYAVENHDIKNITKQYKDVFEKLLFPVR